MKTLKKITSGYRKVCTKAYAFTKKHSTTLMFVLGVALLIGGLHGISLAQDGYNSTDNYNSERIAGAVDALFCLIEGAFGALIMVVAGLAAIISAAMGAYRAAVGLLVVAVGAFILRALVSMFFGDTFGEAITGCEGQ